MAGDATFNPQEPPHQPEAAAPRFSQKQGGRRRLVNVGEAERYASILGGIALLLLGIARRGLGGLFLGGIGAAVIRRGVSGHCPLYRNMGVSTAHTTRAGVPDNVGTRVERSITINRPREEVFDFWRDFQNLPRFMGQIERIDLLDGARSHWVARAGRPTAGRSKRPAQAVRTVEWDARIINEIPRELIAWESLPGAQVQSAGSVRFEPAPGGRGTELKIVFEYNLPGRTLGIIAAKLFGEAPGRQLEEDLNRLKQLLEAGEVTTTAGQPAGRR